MTHLILAAHLATHVWLAFDWTFSKPTTELLAGARNLLILAGVLLAIVALLRRSIHFALSMGVLYMLAWSFFVPGFWQSAWADVQSLIGF